MSMDVTHGHDEQSVPAGEFKQRCLALLDRVAETGTPIVVTKRGRPVARVVPIERPEDALDGSLHVLTENEEELYSIGDVWEVEHIE
jgi:prevent-host-death family protein